MCIAESITKFADLCRRRKIRCNPSRNPHNSRCAHCVKVNKECSFEPVKPRSSAELRANAPPQSSTSRSGTSRSSSPGPSNKPVAEKISPSHPSAPVHEENKSSMYPSRLSTAETTTPGGLSGMLYSALDLNHQA